MVFQNYPWHSTEDRDPQAGLRATFLTGRDATHYPLYLVLAPGQQLGLCLDYRSDLFVRGDAEAIAARLVRLLEVIVAEPDRTVGTVDLGTSMSFFV